MAISPEVSRSENSQSRGSGWSLMHLLPGAWVCLGLVCIWFPWSSHIGYQLAATVAALAAGLGLWHERTRQHQQLLSSMARSERERTETALRESEAHYWELFENACDFVYTCDMHRRFTSINKAGERLLGYT